MTENTEPLFITWDGDSVYDIKGNGALLDPDILRGLIVRRMPDEPGLDDIQHAVREARAAGPFTLELYVETNLASLVDPDLVGIGVKDHSLIKGYVVGRLLCVVMAYDTVAHFLPKPSASDQLDT